MIKMIDSMQHIDIRDTDLTLLRGLSGAIPDLKIFYDDEAFEAAQGKLSNLAYCTQLANSFNLLAEAFEDTQNIDELKARMSGLEHLLKERYDENMRKIFDQLCEPRRSLCSLQLAYENTSNGSKIRLLPMDRHASVGSLDETFWELMKKEIRKLFLKYDLKRADAPCYLSFTVPISTSDAARKVAEFAEEVVAMAMLDIRPFKNPKAVVEYMKETFQIMGSNANLGHLMIAGTHGFKAGLYADYDQKEPLALPLGPALLGRMLNTPVGTTPTSLSGVGLVGINGVMIEYDGERADSSLLAQHGLLTIIDQGKIQGTTTCCNGNIAEYNSFPMMDIFIQVQRNLIAYANQIAHGNFGENDQRRFRNELLSYFNGLYDDVNGTRVIDAPVTSEMIGIYFDPKSKTVFVSIPIKYKGCVSRFRFTLVGQKDEHFERIKKRTI